MRGTSSSRVRIRTTLPRRSHRYPAQPRTSRRLPHQHCFGPGGRRARHERCTSDVAPPQELLPCRSGSGADTRVRDGDRTTLPSLRGRREQSCVPRELPRRGPPPGSSRPLTSLRSPRICFSTLTRSPTLVAPRAAIPSASLPRPCDAAPGTTPPAFGTSGAVSLSAWSLCSNASVSRVRFSPPCPSLAPRSTAAVMHRTNAVNQQPRAPRRAGASPDTTLATATVGTGATAVCARSIPMEGAEPMTVSRETTHRNAAGSTACPVLRFGPRRTAPAARHEPNKQRDHPEAPQTSSPHGAKLFGHPLRSSSPRSWPRQLDRH